jgi:histidyl-tRNA synthetase
MVPDAEVLVILCEVLTKLEIGEFTVKVSWNFHYCPPDQAMLKNRS